MDNNEIMDDENDLDDVPVYSISKSVIIDSESQGLQDLFKKVGLTSEKTYRDALKEDSELFDKAGSAIVEISVNIYPIDSEIIDTKEEEPECN